MDPIQAMAHPVRRYLVDLLAQCEAPSGELAEMAQHHFGVGWPTVSHHLGVLRRCGFVRVRWAEPHRIYRLDDAALGRLERAVADLAAKWPERTGDGYWGRLASDEAPVPGPRRRTLPQEDDDAAIRRILLDAGYDPDTGKTR